MKKRVCVYFVTLSALLSAAIVNAQLPNVDAMLLPASPTSADNLKLSIADRSCNAAYRYIGNSYSVAMAQNNITVTLGATSSSGSTTICLVGPREEIDLGRLPAGSYTLNVVEAANGTGLRGGTVISNMPITVADARATKVAPYVRLDYSGHWWDPNDSGWGLFIWHDARDNVLAAWFTYTPDGKPMWYVFQPKWGSNSSTMDADLMQTSRPPGATSPPPTSPTSITKVGIAGLDFLNFGTADEGRLIYTFTGGPTLTRTIRRFKP